MSLRWETTPSGLSVPLISTAPDNNRRPGFNSLAFSNVVFWSRIAMVNEGLALGEAYAKNNRLPWVPEEAMAALMQAQAIKLSNFHVCGYQHGDRKSCGREMMIHAD